MVIKTKKLYNCLILSYFISVGIAFSQSGDTLSVAEIIASPKKFHNKEVIVKGYLCLVDFETCGVFQLQSDVFNYGSRGVYSISLSEFKDYYTARQKGGTCLEVIIKGKFKAKRNLNVYGRVGQLKKYDIILVEDKK